MKIRNANAAWMLGIALVMFSKVSHSFPFMVKHGYTTCISCHFSPSGGGLLNSYGKFVAGELFGRYNTSEDALRWLTEPEEDKFFNAGVFLRTAQSDRKFSNGTQKFAPQWMQGDLEVVLSKGIYFAEASGGFRGSSKAQSQNESDLFLRTFYVGARDASFSIRAGRFFPEFGVRSPNHNIPTRKYLFWNHNDEPYLVQASKLSPEWDFTAAWMKGPEETKKFPNTLEGKSGYLATVAYKTGHSRSGVSTMEMSDDKGKSKATSIFTTLGYNDHMYVLAELAKKNEINDAAASDAQSWLTTIEWGYEVSKGIFPYLGYEAVYSRTTAGGVEGVEAGTYSYPIGLKFYPYTHFEMVAQYANMKSTSGAATDFGILMLNMYF